MQRLIEQDQIRVHTVGNRAGVAGNGHRAGGVRRCHGGEVAQAEAEHLRRVAQVAVEGRDTARERAVLQPAGAILYHYRSADELVRAVRLAGHRRAIRDERDPGRSPRTEERARRRRVDVLTVQDQLDGRANEALVRFLAAALGVPPRDVNLVSGERGREKRLRITGVDQATLATRLGAPPNWSPSQ